jgi:WD40 repeat protein
VGHSRMRKRLGSATALMLAIATSSLLFVDDSFAQSHEESKKTLEKPKGYPAFTCFSSDGKKLYVAEELGNDCEIKVWDWAAKKILKTKRISHPNKAGKVEVQRFICSADGQFILALIGMADHPQRNNSVCRVVIWNATDFSVVHSTDKFSGEIIKFLPPRDGELIRLLVSTKGIALWTVLRDGQEKLGEVLIRGIPQVDFLGSSCVSISRDGTKIAIPGNFGVKVRDIFREGEKHHNGKFYRDGHTGVVGCAAFSPDMSLLATGAGWFWDTDLEEYYFKEEKDRTVQLRDLKTGKIIGRLDFHKDYILEIHFSHDGQKIVTITNENIIRIWETKSARLLHEIDVKYEYGRTGPGLFSISPESNILAGIFDGAVRLWDINTGRLLYVLPNSTPEK